MKEVKEAVEDDWDGEKRGNQWLLSIRKMALLCRRWRSIILDSKSLYMDTEPWSEGMDRWMSPDFPYATIQLDMQPDETPQNIKKQARLLVKEGFMRYAKCLSIDGTADLSDLQLGLKCLSF